MNRRDAVRVLWLAAILSILMLGLALRGFQSMQQPFVGNDDNGINMATLTALQQTVAGHAPQNYGEMGQVWLLLAVYPLSRWLGLQGAITMLKLAFDLLAFVLVYKIASRLTDSRPAVLFAVACWAVGEIAIWAESYVNFTGDTFAAVAALAFAYSTLRFVDTHKLLWVVLASLSALFGALVWSGGPFVLLLSVAVVVSLALAWVLHSASKSLAVMSAVVFVAWLFFSLVVTPMQLYYASTGPVQLFAAYAVQFLPTPVNLANPLLCQINAWTYSPSHWVAAAAGLATFDYYDGYTFLYQSFAFGGDPSWLLLAEFGFAMFSLPAIVVLFRHRAGTGSRSWTLLALGVMVLVSLPLIAADTRWLVFAYLPLSAIAAAGYGYAPKYLRAVMVAGVIVVAATDVLMLPTMPRPDYATVQFEAASLWLANNSPTNSTVLTGINTGPYLRYWSDRSIYVNFSNSTSYARDANLTRFLFSAAGNLTLLRTMHIDYIVVPPSWRTQPDAADSLSGSCSPPPTANTNIAALTGIDGNTDMRGITQVYSQNGITIYHVNLTMIT